MRPVLFLAGALALAAAPALTQTAGPAPGPAPTPSPPPSNYMSNGPLDLAGSGFRSPDERRQCFNGKYVVGTNRVGAKTLYVQAKSAGIFRLELADACDALNAAERLTVRADGADVVCVGQAATVVLKTSAGPKRCAIDQVRRLSSTEVAELATASRR